ncbi:hypothetical protein LSH36_1076g00027 [Paralvinella palmiformis]|uniref:G patch domain-containing protein 4 n=1 Tax=Paralvinella palmiformis TaxID=53620 RepID=A0AAD9IVW5_9ANNE|nr:hypothetical protein LSH36_1076g00027 [Paralvinella palmiformis]
MTGSGLGSKEDGIKEAIKVKLKFDQAGIGHNRGDEFKFHWWDHAFNKAARNIKVNETQNGIKIKSKGNLEVTSTKKALKVNKKQMIYGMFVKV